MFDNTWTFGVCNVIIIIIIIIFFSLFVKLRTRVCIIYVYFLASFFLPPSFSILLDANARLRKKKCENGKEKLRKQIRKIIGAECIILFINLCDFSLKRKKRKQNYLVYSYFIEFKCEWFG